MNLLQRCAVFLLVIFGFEFTIIGALAVLLATAQVEQEKTAYSHSLVASVGELLNIIKDSSTSALSAALYESSSSLDSTRHSLDITSRQLCVLLENKYATAQDRKEIHLAIKTAKCLVGEVSSMCDLIHSKATPLEYYILIERMRKEGIPVLEFMHTKNQALLSRHIKLREERESQERSTRRAVSLGIVIALVGNVLLAAMLVAGFSRNVTSRLAQIEDNFKRFNADEPLHDLTSGADEIGRLDREFHSFAIALRQSWQKDKDLFSNMPVGLLVVDDQGQIEHANPRSEAYFGLPASAFVGKSVSELDQSGTLSRLLLESGHHSLRQVLERQGGEKFFVDIVLTRFVDHEVEKLMLAIIDVTDREKLAEMKQELLSVVSHDLQAPLMSLGIAIELAESALEAGQVGATNRWLALMKSETARLRRLTSDLLSTARLESQMIPSTKVPINLAHMIEAAVNAVAASASDKDICIVIASMVSSNRIVTDPDRMIQILVNFLSNAIKYSDPGTDITIDCELRSPVFRICVRDNGRGIPVDKLGCIFDPFQQVSDRDKVSGSGLGLTICKMLAESLGGTVGVTSVPDRGSCFWLDLPLRELVPVFCANEDG